MNQICWCLLMRNRSSCQLNLIYFSRYDFQQLLMWCSVFNVKKYLILSSNAAVLKLSENMVNYQLAIFSWVFRLFGALVESTFHSITLVNFRFIYSKPTLNAPFDLTPEFRLVWSRSLFEVEPLTSLLAFRVKFAL